jgi:hypothetical protein
VALEIVLQLAGCGAGVNNTTNAASSAGQSAKSSSSPIVLEGTPPGSVSVGSDYGFEPTVSSGSGTIVFGIEGQPAWTSFDAATGALAGSPAAADVGLSGEIIITAGNGTSTSSLRPFTVQVNPSTVVPSAGVATLIWVAPTENTDGTPLSNLAGYYVHYGNSESALTQTIDVGDAEAITYVVSGLSAGTYYFAVSAYNSLGLEGAWSNIDSKTF